MAKKRRPNVRYKRERIDRIRPRPVKDAGRTRFITRRVPEPFVLVSKRQAVPVEQFSTKASKQPRRSYRGFQPVSRFSACERKKQKARRAFFGYLAAGGGARKSRKHQDRFTVRC